MSSLTPIAVKLMLEDDKSSTPDSKVIPMKTAKNQAQPRFRDTLRDRADQFTTPASRAGQTVTLVAKLLDAGVTPKTIASQLTDNSSNGYQYTEDQVRGIQQRWSHLFEQLKAYL